MSKEFYKMRLLPTEEGLTVRTDAWSSIHETPCFHYCIASHDIGFMNCVIKTGKETPLQLAKSHGRKVKRIAKEYSRFAFDSKEEAFKHLQFLKRKQISHMKRDISFIERFLSDTSDGVLVELLPDTVDLVHGHYIFD